MSRYVYMIDYEDKNGFDQVECYTQSEVIKELCWLCLDNHTHNRELEIQNVKLVEDENREHEEDISYSLAQEVIRVIKYKPKYMNYRSKGEKL